MSYMNRLGNCTNPFQGPTKRVLTVCSAGLLRSPTAANVLYEEYGFNTRACGASNEYALIPIDAVLIEWAEEIVFVERPVYDDVWSNFKDILKRKRLLVLCIPDKFEYGDPELKALIKKQYDDSSIMEKAHL